MEYFLTKKKIILKQQKEHYYLPHSLYSYRVAMLQGIKEEGETEILLTDFIGSIFWGNLTEYDNSSLFLKDLGIRNIPVWYFSDDPIYDYRILASAISYFPSLYDALVKYNPSHTPKGNWDVWKIRDRHIGGSSYKHFREAYFIMGDVEIMLETNLFAENLLGAYKAYILLKRNNLLTIITPKCFHSMIDECEDGLIPKQ